MEDKEIKKIIDKITEEERLELEKEIFFQKNIPNLDEEKILNIKKKSREKLKMHENVKINYKNIIKYTCIVVAIIFLVVPGIMMLIENSYSYIPKEKDSTLKEEEIFILDKTVLKKEADQNITLQSLIWSNDQNMIYVTLEGTGENKVVSGTVLFNGQKIESNYYALSNSNGNWYLGQRISTDLDYKDGDKITYVIEHEDGNEVRFDVNLEKSKGEIDYKKLGPNNIKEGIAIIGIINEEENKLDVKFGSVVEDKGIDIVGYGNELRKDEYDSGIILKDSTGVAVKAKEVKNEDKTYHFEFDTTGLVKPYSLIIPKVTLAVNTASSSYDVVKLKLPKTSKKEVNKVINLSGPNYAYMDKNKAIKIVDINKIDKNTYEINIEFPQNKDNNIKISSVNINAATSKLQPKNDFNGYSETLDKNNILKTIIIQPENNKDTIRLTIQPKNYIVEGNWVLDVK